MDFKQIQLTIPFRAVCGSCYKDLEFSDKKYETKDFAPDGFVRYWCERCKIAEEGKSIWTKNK